MGTDENGIRSVKKSAKDIVWVLCGIFVGSAILMCLDQIFLGDFWFSVRPASIRSLLEFNTREYIHGQRSGSWYVVLSRSFIFPAFLLYLLFSKKPIEKNNLERNEIFVWLIPLVVVFFLTAAAIMRQNSMSFRYIFPAIPVICILAAQFFRFKSSTRGRERDISKKSKIFSKALISWGVLIAAFIIAWFLMSRIPDLLNGTGWESLHTFYFAVISPLATTIMVVCVISKKRGLLVLFISSLSLFFIVYYPLSTNWTELTSNRAVNESMKRFTPYRIFANHLRFDKDVKILISKDIHERSKGWMLGRNKETHCWTFNIFFNQKFDSDQFIDGSWEDILKGDYTCALITDWDWQGMSEEHNMEHLIREYDSVRDAESGLVLLKKNDSSPADSNLDTIDD